MLLRLSTRDQIYIIWISINHRLRQNCTINSLKRMRLTWITYTDTLKVKIKKNIRKRWKFPGRTMWKYICVRILVPVVVFILMQFTNARRISAFGHYACIICTPGICSFIYPWAWLRSMADIGRYTRTNPTYRVKLCILISTRKCPPYTEQWIRSSNSGMK